MTNFLTSIFVIVAVTGGTVFGLYQPEASDPVEEVETVAEGGSYIELEMIAVPYVAEKQVQGYLVSRFTLNLSPDAFDLYGNEFLPRIHDVINREMFAKLAALRKTKPYEVHEVVSASLVDQINADFGAEIVHGIFVNQLEYLDKSSVRTPRETGRLLN